jgi:Sortase domain
MLTAVGVTLLAAGLLTYTTPVTAESAAVSTPAPTGAAGAATPEPLITLPPIGSAVPTSSPVAPADRVSTRVRIAALDIDLPVIPPGDENDYPLCNVAMWIGALGQPGQGRATYLYGHARAGMFLPMLEQSKVKNGKKMLGMIVEVWTSDDQRFLYEITEVRRHQKTLVDALEATEEQLWLQTSEGPKGTVGKLQVLAMPLSQGTSDHKSAHPKARPVDCS